MRHLIYFERLENLNFLLHTGSEGSGVAGEFLTEVLWHGFLDTLKLVPFLFLTYLLMEFIEHRAADKTRAFMKSAGRLGPLAGGALGAVPQCGFSAAAANLYTGRVISLGTLIAVFLSTSDEMLPILISGNVKLGTVLMILAYKAVVGIAIGFAIDLVLKLMHKGGEEINIDEICDNDNCHCERGILQSALHHTATITLFVFIITLAINATIFFIGDENLSALLYDKPVIGHLVAAVFGLIPNCATSVALTTFATKGLITTGTMMSGLLSGAGVGVLVLFRMNKHIKENLLVIGILVLSGVLFGLLADIIPFLTI